MAPSIVEPLIPPLSVRERAQLKKSLESVGYVGQGILVAYDDPEGIAPDGEIIDGLNRKAICEELGIECPEDRIVGLTGDQRRERAFILNWSRRQLTFEQQRAIIRDIEHRLGDNPLVSDRALARLLGVSHHTVGKQRERLEASGAIPHTAPIVPTPTAPDAPARTVVSEPDEDEADADGANHQVSEHMKTIAVKVLVRHWAPSDDPRQRGILPYNREREQKVRDLGWFAQPPECQNDPALLIQTLARPLHRALLADPLPRI